MIFLKEVSNPNPLLLIKMTTKTDFLPILLSARVRLTNEQRDALKAAYRELRNQTATSTDSTGSLTVVTQTPAALEAKLGMSSIVMADLLSSRDSININLVLHLQNVLGVEIVSKTQLVNAAKSYANHIFSKLEESCGKE